MIIIKEFIFIALGAVLGAYSRYLMTLLPVSQVVPRELLIMLVNIIGCLLIGFFAFKIQDNIIRVFLLTGFLGSFTTFSTYALDAHNLWNKSPVLSISYIGLSVILGLIAVLIGKYLAQRIS